MESIANSLRNGYLFIENWVVKGYKTIENGAVEGFTSVNDAITVKLFGKSGESVEEVKSRFKANIDAARECSRKAVEKGSEAVKEIGAKQGLE